jgi:hypothetical protein
LFFFKTGLLFADDTKFVATPAEDLQFMIRTIMKAFDEIMITLAFGQQISGK